MSTTTFWSFVREFSPLVRAPSTARIDRETDDIAVIELMAFRDRS